MTREETQAEARAIYECDYGECVGRATAFEARLAAEVVTLLRERDEARATVALVTTYREACSELKRAEGVSLRCLGKRSYVWNAAKAEFDAAQAAHDAALAALRETPAGEGER